METVGNQLLSLKMPMLEEPPTYHQDETVVIKVHSRRELPANLLSPCTPPLASLQALQLRFEEWLLWTDSITTNKLTNKYNLSTELPIHWNTMFFHHVGSRLCWSHFTRHFTSAFGEHPLSTTTIDQHTSPVSGWNMFGINRNMMQYVWNQLQPLHGFLLNGFSEWPRQQHRGQRWLFDPCQALGLAVEAWYNHISSVWKWHVQKWILDTKNGSTIHFNAPWFTTKTKIDEAHGVIASKTHNRLHIHLKSSKNHVVLPKKSRELSGSYFRMATELPLPTRNTAQIYPTQRSRLNSWDTGPSTLMAIPPMV